MDWSIVSPDFLPIALILDVAVAGEAVPRGVLRCGHALRSAGRTSLKSVDDAF